MYSSTTVVSCRYNSIATSSLAKVSSVQTGSDFNVVSGRLRELLAEPGRGVELAAWDHTPPCPTEGFHSLLLAA